MTVQIPTMEKIYKVQADAEAQMQASKTLAEHEQKGKDKEM